MKAQRGFTIWPRGHKKRSFLKMHPTSPKALKINSSGPGPSAANMPRSIKSVSGHNIYQFDYFCQQVTRARAENFVSHFSSQHKKTQTDRGTGGKKVTDPLSILWEEIIKVSARGEET